MEKYEHETNPPHNPRDLASRQVGIIILRQLHSSRTAAELHRHKNQTWRRRFSCCFSVAVAACFQIRVVVVVVVARVRVYKVITFSAHARARSSQAALRARTRHEFFGCASRTFIDTHAHTLT